ncbi:predicted protein [Thalassiosira pseudonana CCMP1335]|uniref:Uncharacterized protein n=1 Tax=Thalassiosira pseudonana TaxID=35128 RepID=B8C0I1_THAPS|nr:predicted protein [Thalassiosira pseudonana CCMP1335]EED93521.1 predicted protein [Thalassiosira pseudonana CCMP1335]
MANQQRKFTASGLPFDIDASGAALTTTEREVGPARRIDVVHPAASASSLFLLSPPSLVTGKQQQSTSSNIATDGNVASNDDSLMMMPTLLKVQPSMNSNNSRLSLRNCPLRSSLIDDGDDDELVDYFSSSSNGSITLSPMEDESIIATYVSSSPAHQWLLTEHNIPSLPSFYPLDKSSVFIQNTSASTIATRISSILRQRSIVAVYSTPNALANCTSKQNVSFRIRLYRNSTSQDEEGNAIAQQQSLNGIIVEVQRREGFELSYPKDVFAILDGAEGKMSDPSMDESPIFFEDETLHAQVVVEDEEGETAAGDGSGRSTVVSLSLISAILCPKNATVSATIDRTDFALSSLAALTNVDRMGHAAVLISNDLLMSTEYEGLRDVIFANINQKSQVDSSSTSVISSQERPMMKSLEVLANATLSTRGSSSSSFSLGESSILSTLIFNIENSSSNPRVADLSCVILKNSMQSLNMSSDDSERLLQALIKAVSVGSECHADLELHSQQCLGLMNL